jgi:hypothetical protein
MAFSSLTPARLEELIATLRAPDPAPRPPDFRDILMNDARSTFARVLAQHDRQQPYFERVTWRYDRPEDRFIFTAFFTQPMLDWHWTRSCDGLGESARVVNLALDGVDGGFSGACERLYFEMAAAARARRAEAEQHRERMRQRWDLARVAFDPGAGVDQTAFVGQYRGIDLVEHRVVVDDQVGMRPMTATEVDAATRRAMERAQAAIVAAMQIPPMYLRGDNLDLYPEGLRDAEARGLRLLKEWLSPAQLAQYETHRFFDVTGGTSGKRYRVKHGRAQNVFELDGEDREIHGWCFAPDGNLVAGDVMLAQKVALETNERGALNVANLFQPSGPHQIYFGGGYGRAFDYSPAAVMWLDEMVPAQARAWLEGDWEGVRAERREPTAPPRRERDRDEPRVDPRSWMAGWGAMGRDLLASRLPGRRRRQP